MGPDACVRVTAGTVAPKIILLSLSYPAKFGRPTSKLALIPMWVRCGAENLIDLFQSQKMRSKSVHSLWTARYKQSKDHCCQRDNIVNIAKKAMMV